MYQLGRWVQGAQDLQGSLPDQESLGDPWVLEVLGVLGFRSLLSGRPDQGSLLCHGLLEDLLGPGVLCPPLTLEVPADQEVLPVRCLSLPCLL